MADLVQTRPSRIWRIVLVVSLALNLAVAGMIGGRAGFGAVRRAFVAADRFRRRACRARLFRR